MIKTLEQKQQQQTKSTPNIEPHAGNTETTPALSEEDDFEDSSSNNNNSSSSKSAVDLLILNNVLENKNQNQTLENGKRKILADKEIIADATALAANRLLPADKSAVRTEFEDENESATVADEVPSTSHIGQKSAIHIKIEEKYPLPAIKIDHYKEDDDPASPGKESASATCSKSAMYIKKAESSLQETDGIKETSPFPTINIDDDDADADDADADESPSPGKESSPVDEVKNGEASSSSPSMKINEESAAQDEESYLTEGLQIETSNQAEDALASPVIKTNEDEQHKFKEETSSPVLRVDAKNIREEPIWRMLQHPSTKSMTMNLLLRKLREHHL
ncbi:transcription initiation factor TFIID subunit 11-like [Drosophila grimshawi]|uniref:transcription initiation factor TFIID subunit 11-like n=1 Tax=Drosophila grimshawi TaxID=7222 RepID=UPI0013EF39D7|nr:transcription initiation factor TFIID subunit 11-like [Drosophila grimshawi]